mgnify:CR=1 FL=1
MSQATNDILYFTNQYMGTSEQTTFNEASIASYVVAMLPDKYVGTTDILDACSILSEKYAYIDSDRLAVELSDRLLNKENASMASQLKLAEVLIAVGGFLIAKYFIFNKR